MLKTKIYVPKPRPGLIGRKRLLERLDEGLLTGRPFALISAPAGYGKTTLVTNWLEGLDRAKAWLSLDELDNDPMRESTATLYRAYDTARRAGLR
ncbi:hypothetical protein [Desulfosporosinus sp. HMP52]|uniref:hypothetical protein n=1 Tax=Desulfosporosinus sp. HMP52 TaxID=1487923 RepID=UPI000FFE9D49|nr:hypothetical protein [Desulfosporosinus sp. HMP52]